MSVSRRVNNSEVSNKEFYLTFRVLTVSLPQGLGVFSFRKQTLEGRCQLRTHLRLRGPRAAFFSPRRLRVGTGGAAGVGGLGTGPGAERTAPPWAGL